MSPTQSALHATRCRALATLLSCLALSAIAPSVFAQSVIIYRCTDANGALTIQNGTPCPKGSKQDRRVMETAPSSPMPPFVPPAPPPFARPVGSAPAHAPAVAPAPVQTPAVEPAPAVADSDRLPPPWLYECRTYNDDSYLSESGAPAPRCVTLTTTGLGGMVESPNTSACEMKTDQCQRIPDGALCDGWRKRLREGESALRFGVTEDRAKAEAEVQRLTHIVRDSTCGKP